MMIWLANFCEHFHIEICGSSQKQMLGVRDNAFQLDKKYEFHMTAFTCASLVIIYFCSKNFIMKLF